MASYSHDTGLVSSCDPAASEFLLFALALQDQVSTCQANSEASKTSNNAPAGAVLSLERAASVRAWELQQQVADCMHTYSADGLQHEVVTQKTSSTEQVESTKHEAEAVCMRLSPDGGTHFHSSCADLVRTHWAPVLT